MKYRYIKSVGTTWSGGDNTAIYFLTLKNNAVNIAQSILSKHI
jgi:hypothetical protein